MERRIVMATEADTDAVLRLYREQIGREFCFWTDEYPGPDTVEYDLSRDALFVMKDENDGIIAAISIELDEDVDRLECWTPSLQPAGEYARLAVSPAHQRQGLARQMVAHVLGVLKERGCKSVHILVNRDNLPVLKPTRTSASARQANARCTISTFSATRRHCKGTDRSGALRRRAHFLCLQAGRISGIIEAGGQSHTEAEGS